MSTATLLGNIETIKELKLPLYLSRVHAGFPSPAEDHLDKKIDLNDFIRHPAATFLLRIDGDSMTGAGLYTGDLLIVDRSLMPPMNDEIIIASLNGEFAVKRFSKVKGKIFLKPDNPAYAAIEISSEDDFEVWGVLIYSMRCHVRPSRLQ